MSTSDLAPEGPWVWRINLPRSGHQSTNASVPQDVLALGGSEISRLPELFEVPELNIPAGMFGKWAASCMAFAFFSKHVHPIHPIHPMCHFFGSEVLKDQDAECFNCHVPSQV